MEQVFFNGPESSKHGTWSKEEIVSRTFERYGLRLDVDVSSGRVGNDRSYPYIKVASWIQALDRNGKLYNLLGLGPDFNSLERCKPVFQDYWEKYRLMHSGHQVFKLAAEGALKLQCCVPVAFRGDEGTTYKKDGCLVLSFHSVVGKGTLSNKLGPVQDGHLPNLHTNFVGHAFQTRFLLAALLKDPCFGFVLLWV